MAKKQTFTLDFTPEYDFILIGIFCAYRDYRLCFELNKLLDLNLERQTDLELKLDKKGSSGKFPYFLYLTDDEEEIYLISNKGTNAYFIPELKQTDYFFLVKNQSRYTDINELIQMIKSISLVSSVMEPDPYELKSAENFLLLEPVSDADQEKPKLPPVK